MAISDRLNKLTTDITNAYTSIENKGGTIPANKNTENMSTAIDSIEVIEQATAEGESLSLANTKAMPYSDYVVKGKSTQSGEPSPSNPSEIHSVADDVNLWSLNSSYITATGSEYVLRDTIISTISAGTYTLSLNKSINSKVMFAFKNASNQEFDVILDGIEQKTITFTDDKFKTAIYIYGNQACTISNIKLQKGSVATPYSPYNQGTVTIKQRGKNLFDYNSYTYDKTILNAYRFIEIKNTKPSTNYTIYNYDDLTQSGFDNVLLAHGPSYSEISFVNLVGADYVRFYTKTDGKMYLCTYASNWTEELWNTFISYFENAQLEERNNTNFLRTISS